MHGNTDIFTKEKTIPLYSVEDMVKFALEGLKQEDKVPHDIQPYIDYDKGWKFTENDKEFLIKHYEEWVKAQNEEFDGDFVEEPTEVLNSIKEKGVIASKELIQESAAEMAYAVVYDIYQYYANDHNTLKLIENSILDAQW